MASDPSRDNAVTPANAGDDDGDTGDAEVHPYQRGQEYYGIVSRDTGNRCKPFLTLADAKGAAHFHHYRWQIIELLNYIIDHWNADLQAFYDFAQANTAAAAEARRACFAQVWVLPGGTTSWNDAAYAFLMEKTVSFCNNKKRTKDKRKHFTPAAIREQALKHKDVVLRYKHPRDLDTPAWTRVFRSSGSEKGGTMQVAQHSEQAPQGHQQDDLSEPSGLQQPRQAVETPSRHQVPHQSTATSSLSTPSNCQWRWGEDDGYQDGLRIAAKAFVPSQELASPPQRGSWLSEAALALSALVRPVQPGPRTVPNELVVTPEANSVHPSPTMAMQEAQPLQRKPSPGPVHAAVPSHMPVSNAVILLSPSETDVQQTQPRLNMQQPQAHLSMPTPNSTMPTRRVLKTPPPRTLEPPARRVLKTPPPRMLKTPPPRNLKMPPPPRKLKTPAPRPVNVPTTRHLKTPPSRTLAMPTPQTLATPTWHSNNPVAPPSGPTRSAWPATAPTSRRTLKEPSTSRPMY